VGFITAALLGLGTLGILGGLVWMGQGSGYFPYPASSFMIDQSVWIGRGAAMAVLGAAMVVLSLRLRRRR
jgi:hypothetical protein